MSKPTPETLLRLEWKIIKLDRELLISDNPVVNLCTNEAKNVHFEIANVGLSAIPISPTEILIGRTNWDKPLSVDFNMLSARQSYRYFFTSITFADAPMYIEKIGLDYYDFSEIDVDATIKKLKNER